MKYFDIEYVNNKSLSEYCFSVTKSSKASEYSDEYYNSLYRKCLKEYLNESKRICKFLKKPFDKEQSVNEFSQSNIENIEYIKQNLPKDILDSIADIRVLSLGSADPDAFDKITSFCGKLYRKCQEIENEFENQLQMVKEKFGEINVENLLQFLYSTPKRAQVEGNSLIINSGDNELISDKTMSDQVLILDSLLEISGIDSIGQTVCQVELLLEEQDILRVNCLLHQANENAYTEFSASAKSFRFEKQ